MTLILYLTRVHFADNVLEDALSEELAHQGIASPLIVTDFDSGSGDGMDRLCFSLPTSMVSATYAPPTTQIGGNDIASTREMLKNHGSDGIIGFGSMTALDLARVVGSREQLPVITIPTSTASIGLGPIGGEPNTGLGQRAKLPVAILCDATLSTGTSPARTAAAGMDALIHCLESFLSTAFNPPADGIALDGLRRAARHLEAAVQNGKDISARRELLAAALDAGLAAEKGFGGIEAASHGLEAMTPSRHGALHGALLTEILTFNAPAVSDRLDRIRTTLELPVRVDPAKQLADLAERIGLPLRLSEIGIAADILPRAALHAAADPANCTNPRHATAQDYERMMRAIF